MSALGNAYINDVKGKVGFKTLYTSRFQLPRSMHRICRKHAKIRTAMASEYRDCVSRCFRLNVFPNCLPEPHTASRIGKDTKVVLTAIIVTITVRTRSYLLDEDQEQQAEDRGRALPGGGERPGPPGNGGAHGQRVDSRWGTPLPSPGRHPARCRPPLPCRDFTSAGTLLERSEMYHRRPPAAFFPARGRGGNVCTNPVRARGEESL